MERAQILFRSMELIAIYRQLPSATISELMYEIIRFDFTRNDLGADTSLIGGILKCNLGS